MTADRDNLQKPKIGLMLFLTDRLRAIGEGEPGGTYAVVAEAYAKSVVEELGTDIEWVFPCLLYTSSGESQGCGGGTAIHEAERGSREGRGWH